MCEKYNETSNPFSLLLKGDLELKLQLKKPKKSRKAVLYHNDSAECMHKMRSIEHKAPLKYETEKWKWSGYCIGLWALEDSEQGGWNCVQLLR